MKLGNRESQSDGAGEEVGAWEPGAINADWNREWEPQEELAKQGDSTHGCPKGFAVLQGTLELCQSVVVYSL